MSSVEEFERVRVSHFGIDMDSCQAYRHKLLKLSWLEDFFSHLGFEYLLLATKKGIDVDNCLKLSQKYESYADRANFLQRKIKTRKELFYKF